MVNLAEIDKQMAEALFQLLKVKQSIKKKEETKYIKPRDAHFELTLVSKTYLHRSLI
jgi:hypothetical protein